MRCCFVRHGETPWNAERRLQGHQDIALNALGLAQAEAAARYLGVRHAESPFAAVVSSDLQRARQTADAIAQALGLTVQNAPGLRERHYGHFEGKTPAEADYLDSLAYAALVARADLRESPGNAEPLAAMVARIEACLHRLAQDYADQSVVLVTHGGVLDVLYRRAMRRDLTGPRDAPIPNAGLNWLDLAPAGEGLQWTMLAWGETGHLKDASLDEIL
ncbi:MAG: histidine phosphatase family protein [Rhodocyclaceae bacterium]|nr:histidine phosphatase family protein [Rhodocyclaceae bacterium]